MDHDKYYKTLFLIAAIYNWAVALAIIFLYPILFPLMGFTVPNTALWIQISMGLVGVFGIGYFMVSLDLKENRIIVPLGAIGKILVFCALLFQFLGGEPLIILLIGIVDLVFAILFIEFLFNY